ncbi:hypothetical protein QBE52_02890 [Clostridiaceae bacterium 35-E11]
MGWKSMNHKRRLRVSDNFIKYFTIAVIIFSIALLIYGQKVYNRKISDQVKHRNSTQMLKKQGNGGIA